METDTTTQSPGRVGRSRGQRRTRRRLAILGALGLLLGGWKYKPDLEYSARLIRAEWAMSDGRFVEARESLDLLIAEKPTRTAPRLLRVRIAREEGHVTEAEEGLQRAIELGLSVESARREHDLLRGRLSAFSDQRPVE